MNKDITTTRGSESLFAGEAWFDPIEANLRGRVRGFIETMLEEELSAALGRGRYQRGEGKGHRHGRRERQLLGSFGPVTVSVPRARLVEADGTTQEWRSAALPRYTRMTRQAEALIASTYLAGTNTRRVKRALGALFKGAVGKDVENDQFPNRDRPKASPLASPQQPMDHVFLRGQIHQKLFGRSPRVHDSAIRFHRHRRAADPSWFFKSLDRAFGLRMMTWPRREFAIAHRT